MKITYHGHSVVSIITNDGTTLLIDPFFTGNSLADLRARDVSADYLLITHGHNDHVGDMISIAKKNKATIIAIPEIVHFATKNGVEQTHAMNIGGSYEFPFGRVKMVYAQHSSGYELGADMVYMGEPAGFVLEIEGKTLYHAGDTAYFSDMSLLSDDFEMDVAFLPIGDNFTMGIKDAVKASETIKAKTVIPIHYNTFPVIQQDPKEFVNLLSNQQGKVMDVGESIDI